MASNTVMVSTFGRQEAEVFMQNFVKLDEVRQGIRAATIEDMLLNKSQQQTKADWLFLPETLANPGAEGRRIGKLLYESALTAGGETKFMTEEYFPEYFEGCTKHADKYTEYPEVYARLVAIRPFFEEAAAVFKEMLAAQRGIEYTAAKSNSFAEQEAVEYFKNLSVILNAKQAARPFTPEEQKLAEKVEEVEKSWFADPEVEKDPVKEGKRIGKLLYKHAATMEADKDVALKYYFPSLLAMPEMPKQETSEGPMDAVAESFLTTALSTFVEARDKNEE